MKMILQILLFVSTAVSFFWGSFHFSGKKVALFKTLVVFAFGCFMLGGVFELVTLLIQGSVPQVFHIGMLAVVGGFSFVYSASYGQMDWLADDGSAGLRKYRLLALLAPLVIAALYIPVLRCDIIPTAKLITGAQFLMLALAAYYNFKHLIIPDVFFGIIASIRGYNLLALLLELLYATRLMAGRVGNEIVWAAASACVVVLCPMVLPVMERGSKKWTL